MRNFLLCCSLAFLLGACELFSEPSPGLPPKTQTGENTFGCKVNGKLWLPYAERSFAQSGPLKWELGNNTFSLKPYNEKDYFQGILVSLRPGESIQEGKTYFYDVNDSVRYHTPDSTNYYLSWGGVVTKECNYGLPTHGVSYSEGWIKITKYAPLAKESNIGIIAGEFEYKTYPNRSLQFEACDTLTQPIHVTEGRFDIQTLKR